MKKSRVYALWTALLLLAYGLICVIFVAVPAFESRALDGKKEIMIITLLPLAALILSVVLFFTKKLDHVFEKSPGGFLNSFFIVYMLLIMILCPLALYTERIYKLEMCQAVWNFAWPLSLLIAMSVTLLLFRYGKDRVDFTGQLIFLCVLAFPVAYFLPVLCFKLMTSWSGCLA